MAILLILVSCTQLVCATVFGKDEDGGGFEFSQELVDEVVQTQRDWLTGTWVTFYPTVSSFLLRPVVNLCISGASRLSVNQVNEDSFIGRFVQTPTRPCCSTTTA